MALARLTVLEPTTGTTRVEGIIELSHPADTAVELTLASSDGSAQAGLDYLPVNQRLTIAPGSLEARFEVMVLADALVEADEVFQLTASAVTGALLQEASVPCRLRDTTSKPVVYAAPAVLFENGRPGAVPIHLLNAVDALPLPWSALDVPHPGLPGPLLAPPMATVGEDLPPQAGTAVASPGAPAIISLTAQTDAVDEPDESVAVAWPLDPSVAAASFSPRVFPLFPAPDLVPPQASTDGDWVVVAETATTGDPPSFTAFHMYARDASAPGGWSRTHILDLEAAGVPAGTRGRFRIRHGRLVYHPYEISRAWFFTAPEKGAGDVWKLEAAPAAPGIGSTSDWDFDGDSLVVPGYHSLLIMERGDGSWTTTWNLPLESEGFSSYRTACVIDGAVCASFFINQSGEPGIQILERTGPPSRPWLRRAFLPNSPYGHQSLVLQGAELASVTYGLSSHSVLHHRTAAGEWQTGQTLDDVIEFIDQGLLFGLDRVFARTGDDAAPWIALGPGPHHGFGPGGGALDLHRNVMAAIVSYRGSDAVDRPGLAVFEPGVGLTVVEESSVPYTVEQVSAPYHELPDREGFVEVVVRAPFALPSAVEIPFTTIPGGTATPDIDYRPVAGTVVIPAGQQDARFRVPVLPDRLIEGDESIHVRLSTPTFGVAPSEPFALTVKEPPLAFLAQQQPFTVFEPASGQQAFTIPITLARPLAVDTIFTIELVPISASPDDAALASTTFTLPAGRSVLAVPLVVSADALAESTESLALRARAPNVDSHQVEVRIEDAAGAGAPDAFTTAQSVALDASPERNVLANDPPGSGPVQGAHPPEGGSVEWRTDGTFEYMPQPNLIGLDTFSYRSGEPVTLSLPAFTPWKWLHWTEPDFGGPASVVPGFDENWMTPGFDDSSWPVGTWLMGYGPMGEPPLPIDTPLGDPPPPKWFGAYFRTSFEAPDQPAPGLTLTLMYDDAVIIYLNGTEIGRHGKEPLGAFATEPDSYLLLAHTATRGAEETQWHTLSFPNVQVRPGANVLAISLHNSHRLPDGEPDLGLSVADVTIGTPVNPVRVDVLVTDAQRPPVVRDDAIVVTGTTSPLDSRYWPNGSAYANDGLLSPAGTAYDPILEVETGGTPVGPVTFDAPTGHFRLGAPYGFFGSTAFTYRVRDKDGWSLPAAVTVTVTPTRAFDRWRLEHFGGGSMNPLSAPDTDAEADTRANLVEFALGTDPLAPDLAPPLSLERRAGSWIAVIVAQNGFGFDAFIDLEGSASLAAPEWSRLARLNDAYPSLETLAPGVTTTTEALPENKTRYSITLPPTPGSTGFVRLRVSQERHALDP